MNRKINSVTIIKKHTKILKYNVTLSSVNFLKFFFLFDSCYCYEYYTKLHSKLFYIIASYPIRQTKYFHPLFNTLFNIFPENIVLYEY